LRQKAVGSFTCNVDGYGSGGLDLLIARGFEFRVLELGQWRVEHDYICPPCWLQHVGLPGRKLGGWWSQLEFWHHRSG
jgi:hypothetical protein